MTATGAGLSRTEARWAIAQTSVADMHSVLAYAEAFGMLAAGVGVTMGAPVRLVQRVVEETVAGAKPWQTTVDSFPEHLRKAVRLEIASHMTLHARTRGREPRVWEAKLALTQVGDLRGVEKLGHWSGQMMAAVRSNDGAMLVASIDLTDFVRAKLAPWAGNPDEEDTDRIVGLPPAPNTAGDENAGGGSAAN